MKLQKQLVNLYYFKSEKEIELNQIEGHALVITDDQVSTNIKNVIEYKVFFVSGKSFIKNKDGHPKCITDRRSLDLWQTMLDKLDGNRVKLDSTHDTSDQLSNLIYATSMVNKFPYNNAIVFISPDAKSFTITERKSGEIHPLLQEFLENKNNPNYNLLRLLYAIKRTPDFMQGADIRQEGGGPFMSHYNFAIDIDEMINQVREDKGFMPLAVLESNIKKLGDKFAESELTKQKKTILNSFKNFYRDYAENPEMAVRSVIVETWANQYMNLHNINPFTTLSQQRRTDRLRIFNPSRTNSMKLFDAFLSGEAITDSLKQIMSGAESDKKENVMLDMKIDL